MWLIMAVPAIYLAIIWEKLPEKVAMHFDWQGNPDRIAPKDELILFIAILTAVNIGVYLLLRNMHRFDPRKNADANKSRLEPIAFAVSVFISGICCLMIYSSKKGSIELSIGLILSATGLLFAVIGNYMTNMKPNYFAGFRLPWTLEDSDNWKKTHLLGGRLWFAGGLLIAITCLFLPFAAGLVVFITVMTVITVIPCVYSYRLFKRK